MENDTEPGNVRGIIFDLDGTLYRMRWFMRPLFLVYLFPRFSRLPRFLKMRSRYAGVDLGSRDALLAAVATGLAEREHVPSEGLVRWVYDRFYPAFVATMPLQRSGRPHLGETMLTLKERGLKLAVLSDYHAVPERLEKLRIPTECFDIMASCEAAGALKPAPRPFLEIAAAWGIVPASILVVGDRDDTDGEAARSAGMQFLLLSDGGKRPSTVPVRSWEAVRNVLLNIGR